ncbi:PH domain-containing protein [Streptomyces sirii]|uniref:PH domain-containing protein n=1 Tax=Streptomyces sirii TaxID=3127701 RepID=UPI003D36D823
MLTLLHKDPDRRYSNAADLSRALRQLGRAPEPECPSSHEARNILLARMARAMSTSLARRAALSQDARGNGAVQTARSQVKTTVQMSPTAPLASFDVSWTGQEPLSAYAAGPRTTARWITALLSSAIAVACFYFPLHLGLVTPGATAGQDGWVALMSVGGGIGGLLALGATGSAITGTFVITKHAGARKARSPWALHVDPRGIATGSAAGRREVPWDRIQRVSIEEIQGSPPYRYTGIHIDLKRGASKPTMLRPAGWPYPQPDTVKARRRVPVCVLGPMTERQRTELIEALAGYGGQRWVPSVHFTTLPVGL